MVHGIGTVVPSLDVIDGRKTAAAAVDAGRQPVVRRAHDWHPGHGQGGDVLLMWWWWWWLVPLVMGRV